LIDLVKGDDLRLGRLLARCTSDESELAAPPKFRESADDEHFSTKHAIA